MLHVAVCGAGAFGRNHIRIYRDLEQQGAAASLAVPVRLAAIVESDPSRSQALHQELNVPVFTSIEDLLEARAQGQIIVDAVSVCVPTSQHAAVAAPLLEAGIDVLIEKPIAATREEAAALVALAAKNQRIVQVGHLERFNPAVAAMQDCLNGPMFFEAHRLSVFTPRALDVDVVLDLMIHDLDIVLSLAKSPVRDLHAVGLPILSGKVDIANVRVEFESGCVANFTASRVSTERVRKLRFFQPHQYVSIDYARQDLLVIDVSAAATGAAAGAPSTPAIPGLPAGLALQKPKVEPGEPLRLEIISFLESVSTRQTPRVSAEDGQAALDLALTINEAIAEHARRAGLDRFASPAIFRN
ncbi:Gfo/Idh/MocA family oxidoreductase [Silvibacterium dinghuense]|uniref:Gfo/Idh/MocA family oxidoreductase n=1 Tax=Silvibacterium dinghuense TaxID=1560006 RepID=A0A4Q1SLZ5_9BACT|nr:Gfo/Idh/MocA family oxidoreductase [Silvibacterium dinghuense]